MVTLLPKFTELLSLSLDDIDEDDVSEEEREDDINEDDFDEIDSDDDELITTAEIHHNSLRVCKHTAPAGASIAIHRHCRRQPRAFLR